jgi:hypothetical protein
VRDGGVVSDRLFVKRVIRLLLPCEPLAASLGTHTSARLFVVVSLLKPPIRTNTLRPPTALFRAVCCRVIDPRGRSLIAFCARVLSRNLTRTLRGRG